MKLKHINAEFYRKNGYKDVGLQHKTWFVVDETMMEKVLRDKPFPEIFDKYLKTSS